MSRLAWIVLLPAALAWPAWSQSQAATPEPSQARSHEAQAPEVPNVWLGLTLRSLKGPEDQPRLQVEAVVPESPADSAGLREGDELVSLDGRPVRDHGGLLDRLRTRRPGEIVRLGIEREQRVTLDAAPDDPDDERAQQGRRARLGISLSSASGRQEKSEVRIEEIEPGSAAERAGLRADSTLLEIDGAEVASSEDAQKKIQAHRPGEEIMLRLRAPIEVTLAERPGSLRLEGPRLRVVPGDPEEPQMRGDLADPFAPPQAELQELRRELRRLHEELSQLQRELTELKRELGRMRSLR